MVQLCKVAGLYIEWLRFPTPWLTDRQIPPQFEQKVLVVVPLRRHREVFICFQNMAIVGPVEAKSVYSKPRNHPHCVSLVVCQLSVFKVCVLAGRARECEDGVVLDGLRGRHACVDACDERGCDGTAASRVRVSMH